MEEIKKKDLKNHRVDIRMTDEEYKLISELCYLTGENRTEAITKAVKFRLNLERSK